MKSFEEELLDPATTPRELSPTWSDLDSVDLQSEAEVIFEPKPLVVSETASAVHCKYHVAIPNVAANTLQALIHFVYTGKIHFSPLKSQGLEVRRVAQESHRNENPHLPPLCSPKSVYRLAKIVGLPSLQQLARDEIKVRISSKSIAEELFSSFSSTYEDILNMQLEILCRNGMLPEIMPQVTKAIAGVCEGQKPYCDRVLTALVQKLSTLLPTPNLVNEPVPSAMPPRVADSLVSPTAPEPQPFIAPSVTHHTSLPPSSIPISSMTDANSAQQATVISPDNAMSQAENLALQEEERHPTDDVREEGSQTLCEEDRRTCEELRSFLDQPAPLFEELKRRGAEELEGYYKPEGAGLADAQLRPAHSKSPREQRYQGLPSPERAAVPSCLASSDTVKSSVGVPGVVPSISHVNAAPDTSQTDVSVLRRQNRAGNTDTKAESNMAVDDRQARKKLKKKAKRISMAEDKREAKSEHRSKAKAKVAKIDRRRLNDEKRHRNSRLSDADVYF